MKERIHDSMVEEARQGTRTDTIIVLVAILLNLVLLGISSAMAGGRSDTTTLILFILIAVVIVINVVAMITLLKGRERREKLTAGLVNMYKEEGMEKYYDPSLLKGYETRYNLFILVIATLGVVAIAVPLVIFFTTG